MYRFYTMPIFLSPGEYSGIDGVTLNIPELAGVETWNCFSKILKNEGKNLKPNFRRTRELKIY